jgi:hypothetical protein
VQVFKLGHSQKCPHIISCSSSPCKQSVTLLHKSSVVIHFEFVEQRNAAADDDKDLLHANSNQIKAKKLLQNQLWSIQQKNDASVFFE